MATMVNMSSLLNGKDSRWLQLEVCREFQRNKCSRPDTECKFAHPPANVEVQNGRVTACYDSIKGRCNREKPPCKYFHPPQHLKDQLLINGRNHLALKNALMQQMGLTPGQVLPGQVPAVASSPYLTGVPGVGSSYSPYAAAFAPQLVPLMGHDPAAAAAASGSALQPHVVQQQKMPRADRLEMDMKSVGSFYYENFAFPGMAVPYKRPAADKAGMPVYQPPTTYQQLVQLQQPFVPVSCEYSVPAPAPATSTATSAPAPAPATPVPSPPARSSPPPTQPQDAAALAKEVAHKNYAAALKLAAQQQAAAAYGYAAAMAGKSQVPARAPFYYRAMPPRAAGGAPQAWAPPMAPPAQPTLASYYPPPFFYSVPPPPATPTLPTSPVVLNPYKKMKTT